MKLSSRPTDTEKLVQAVREFARRSGKFDNLPDNRLTLAAEVTAFMVGAGAIDSCAWMSDDFDRLQVAIRFENSDTYFSSIELSPLDKSSYDIMKASIGEMREKVCNLKRPSARIDTYNDFSIHLVRNAEACARILK